MSELDKYFIHIRQQEGKKRTFLACLNKRENSGWVKEVKENMMHCKQPEKNGNDERMTQRGTRGSTEMRSIKDETKNAGKTTLTTILGRRK